MRPAGDLATGLPLRRGEAMRSLDVAGVPELQPGVDAVVALPERHRKFGPIAARRLVARAERSIAVVVSRREMAREIQP